MKSVQEATNGSASAFPHLLSPLQVGPMTIRNRVLVSAHQPGMAEDGHPSDHYVAYQRARARGGAGLQITGATAVHATGMFHGPHFLLNLDDGIIPGYKRLARAVHEEGGRILAQLGHAGAAGLSYLAEMPLWAPSPVPSELVREVPHAMTLDEIAEVVESFGQAARRVREGEMDGVEILGAYGLLIAAFMSPYANKRTDEYGGSLENRLRFCLEIVDAVRAATGPDLIVGIRIPGDEMVTEGLHAAQMQEIAQRLEATGKLDYFNVIAGTNLNRMWRVGHWPATPSQHGLFVPLAAAIKQVVTLPVFTVGRVVDPRHAERILSEGFADMVGMTRAHISDPDLVSKTRAGRLDDIRPCVGANVCIRNNLEGRAIRCIHNPEVGHEVEWGPLTPATQAKHVVVIGGGPGGLEAARVAALRGHRVDLFERQNVLGGQLRLWAKVSAMRELRRMIDWQETQLQKLGVTVHLNSEMSPQQTAQLGADAIIIATGSHPHEPAIPGAEGSNIRIVTPHAVLADEINATGRVVVWDEGGGQVGVSAAEMLADHGATVELLTPGFAVAEDVHLTMRIPMYKRLLSAGVTFTSNHQVVRLEGEDIIIRNIYSQKESRLPDVALLVAWRGNRVTLDPWLDLKTQQLDVHLVGDCLSPRLVENAMTEAAKVARAL
ncbi:MAG: FAD-dependent oxidoreductase [Ardenticatenaceae bacterium]